MSNISEHSKIEENNFDFPKPIPQSQEEKGKERGSAASVDPLKKQSNTHPQVASHAFIENSNHSHTPLNTILKTKVFGYALKSSTMGFILIYFIMVCITGLLIIIF